MTAHGTYGYEYQPTSTSAKAELILNSVAPEVKMVFGGSTPIVNDIVQENIFWNACFWNAWRITTTQNRPVFIITNLTVRTQLSAISRQDGTFSTDAEAQITAGIKATGPHNYNPKTIFIFPTGDDGLLCLDRQIHACTFAAAVTHGLRAKGIPDADAMMWIGALKDDASDITDYSHTAGLMKNDFMVAHDDVL